jgi:hypothetical protein
MDTEEIKQPEDKETLTASINLNGSTGPKGIDWNEAKAYYMESFTRSYADVAKKYGVSLTIVEKRGNDESWVKVRQELGEKALLEFEENKIMEIAKANKNHITIFRSLQAHAAKQLYNKKDIKAGEVSAIASALKIAIEGERLILGLPTTVSKSEILGRLTTDLNLTPDKIAEMDKFFKGEVTNQ